MMPQNSLPAPPCPRALASMDTDELLDLMETHGDERHADQEQSIARIGAALAQRLGIHCESYLALVLAGTSPREWRGLAGMATTR
jgi:hypothetical protein